MRRLKYEVKLTKEERGQLQEILDKGTHPAKMIKRVNALFELDYMARCGYRGRFRPTLSGIAGRCGLSVTTVHNISKQYNKEGLQNTLTGKKRKTPPIQPIITGEAEARIVALACGEPPEGYSRRTLRLLGKKAVGLGIVERASDNTIGRMLKKHR